MPFIYVTPDNTIGRMCLKISPFDKPPEPGWRILEYKEPYYDKELETLKIKEPISEVVEFTILPVSNKLDIIKKRKAAVIQNLLDSTARSYGYDSILSAVSYATDPDNIFYQESLRFSRWRSLCWASAFEFINTSTEEQLLNLTDQDVINSMPKL